jgi:hypothetical protein
VGGKKYIRRIVRLKSYREQRKNGAKMFVIEGDGIAFSFIIIIFLPVFAAVFLNYFCGYSYFDLLELPEASRSGWK